jgi:hypothetical protein
MRLLLPAAARRCGVLEAAAAELQHENAALAHAAASEAHRGGGSSKAQRW